MTRAIFAGGRKKSIKTVGERRERRRRRRRRSARWKNAQHYGAHERNCGRAGRKKPTCSSPVCGAVGPTEQCRAAVAVAAVVVFYGSKTTTRRTPRDRWRWRSLRHGWLMVLWRGWTRGGATLGVTVDGYSISYVTLLLLLLLLLLQSEKRRP